MPAKRIRHLGVVLGDQLDAPSSAFDGFDPARDGVWMGEAAEERTRVWSHQARIARILAAMRHFREESCRRGRTVRCRRLDDAASAGSLEAGLGGAARELRPGRLLAGTPRMGMQLRTLGRLTGAGRRAIQAQAGERRG